MPEDQLELFEESQQPISEDQKGWYWCHVRKKYVRYSEWHEYEK